MFKPRNIGFTIGPLPVAYWQFNDFKVKLESTEQQIKITERVEIPKIRPVFNELMIIAPENYFRPATGDIAVSRLAAISWPHPDPYRHYNAQHAGMSRE